MMDLKTGDLKDGIGEMDQELGSAEVRKTKKYVDNLPVVLPEDDTLVSAADVATLLNRQAKSCNTKLNVSIHPESTAASVRSRKNNGDEVHIQFAVLADYQEAFTRLKGHLSTFSESIYSIFGPPQGASTEPGKILLKSRGTMLWVCYNVFLCVLVHPTDKILSGMGDKSSEESDQESSDKAGGKNYKASASIGEQLRRCIEEGIKKKTNVVVPVLALGEAPSEVLLHQNFRVEVSGDVDHYYQVRSDGGRVFEFVAYKTGKTDITFCFAQRDTLYPFSIRHTVEVSPNPMLDSDEESTEMNDRSELLATSDPSTFSSIKDKVEEERTLARQSPSKQPSSSEDETETRFRLSPQFSSAITANRKSAFILLPTYLPAKLVRVGDLITSLSEPGNTIEEGSLFDSIVIMKSDESLTLKLDRTLRPISETLRAELGFGKLDESGGTRFISELEERMNADRIQEYQSTGTTIYMITGLMILRGYTAATSLPGSEEASKSDPLHDISGREEFPASELKSGLVSQEASSRQDNIFRSGAKNPVRIGDYLLAFQAIKVNLETSAHAGSRSAGKKSLSSEGKVNLVATTVAGQDKQEDQDCVNAELVAEDSSIVFAMPKNAFWS
ncbi:hypothetical protein Dda_3887 [Drechslerella dactyloides]|uniref:Uncharacterized protein n=1 Tax=Drechslerella dactyloides TaxID=74499 RepID=A0AAD6NJY2_DREDA|nr:hypothetical protein Dda_3887 [Drechslerella dactyloides]